MMDGKRMVIGIERWRDGKMVSMMGLMKVLDRYYKLKGKFHHPYHLYIPDSAKMEF